MLNGKKSDFEVDVKMNVQTLKMILEDKEGIPIEKQHLLMNGKYLDNKRRLDEYDVQKMSNITMTLSLGQ